MRTSVRVALSGLVAVALLALLAAAVGWESLLEQVRAADPAWLALAGAVSLLSLAAWSEETVRLLGAAGSEASGLRVRAAYFAGVFGKLVAPGGHVGGVGVVAYVLGQETGDPFERTLVAVSASEFLNNVASATLATVGVVYLLVAAGASGRFVQGAVVAVVGLVGGLVALYVLLVRFEGAERVLATVASALRRTLGRVSERVYEALDPERVEERLEHLRETIDAVRDDRRTLATSVGIAHVGWVCYALPLYCSLQAVGADVAFPVAFFVVPVAGLAAIVSTPGGLGAVEGATAAALVWLTPLEPAVATAATLLFRAATLVLTVLVTGVVAVYVVATSDADPFAGIRSP